MITLENSISKLFVRVWFLSAARVISSLYFKQGDFFFVTKNNQIRLLRKKPVSPQIFPGLPGSALRPTKELWRSTAPEREVWKRRKSFKDHLETTIKKNRVLISKGQSSWTKLHNKGNAFRCWNNLYSSFVNEISNEAISFPYSKHCGPFFLHLRVSPPPQRVPFYETAAACFVKTRKQSSKRHSQYGVVIREDLGG